MADRGAPIRDLFFFAVAVAVHGALFASNPGVRWGSLNPPEKIIPIEFVQMPASPFLAPLPPGTGDKDEIPDNGPGPRVVAKAEAPKTEAPKPKLDAPKPVKAAQAAPAPKKPSGPTPAQLAAIEARRAAKLAAIEARRAAQFAAAEARRKRVELARELSRTLAGLKDPDENIAEPEAGAAAGPGAPGRSEASLLASTPGFEPESDLRDAVGSRASGGGIKRSEGSLSWSIDGPIGTRKLLKRQLPASPDWVARRGLDLTVRVKFQVLEDGSVKQGALIKVTSGFPELDRIALDAIRRWKFEAVPGQGALAPQTWGVVTFRFTMG